MAQKDSACENETVDHSFKVQDHTQSCQDHKVWPIHILAGPERRAFRPVVDPVYERIDTIKFLSFRFLDAQNRKMYQFPSKPLQVLNKEFIYTHDFQNLVTINIKEIFLANILTMRKQASGQIETNMYS